MAKKGEAPDTAAVHGAKTEPFLVLVAHSFERSEEQRQNAKSGY
jgi:hypothetical protein